MEDACAPPERENDGESDAEDRLDDEEEDEPEMRTYSVGELLRNTVQSYKDRGWDSENEENDSSNSSGSVPRSKKKKKKKKKNAPGQKKRQCRRVWNPEGEYSLVRSGPPLLYEDPDECIAHLTEKSLTIFKHNDPTVVYGEDPDRPLWKGVFRMAVGGYGKDEYYDPKRTHLKAIYSADFPKKNRPADNLQVTRDGVTELPYWVDEWHHAKLSEKGHKQKSKKKLQEKSRIALAEQMRPDTPTVLAPVENVVFPLAGWFKTNLSKKSKGLGEGQAHGFSYSLSLPADAAGKTVKLIPGLVAQLGPVGTVPIQITAVTAATTGTAPVTTAKSKPIAVTGKTAAVGAAATAPVQEPKKTKKRVIKEDDDEDDDKIVIAPGPAPEKKVKFAVTAPPPPPPVPVVKSAAPSQDPQLIASVMRSFYDAASAGMAAQGTYYYKRLCEEGASYEEFFGPGGPADCVLPIVQMLMKRLK